MKSTTIVGVERVNGNPYEVTLTPGSAVELPAELVAVAPAAGAPVVSGPAGVQVMFDPADPVAVYVWLRGSTDVVFLDGPVLTPAAGDSDADDSASEVVH